MSCAEKYCEYSVFENNKCIFHCEKTLDNGWILNNHNKYSKYNEKIKLFWEEFIICHQKNINNALSNINFSINFIIPFYHTNLIEGSTLADIRTLNNLKFHGAIFVDDFIIHNGTNIKKLAFSNCSFKADCYLSNMNLEYLFIIHNNFNKRLTIQNLDINDGEIMDLKSILSKKISINLIDIKVNKKLEIWQFNDKNIKLEISNSKFQELELKELILNAIICTYKNEFTNKLKLVDIDVNNLYLENTDFGADSKILFENIQCKNFSLSQLSQDSKYIQFNHMEISDNLNINKTEFKNTYFNDFNIEKAKKTINKVSFVNSHLNSIEWGNVNKIQANRDVFRELKYIYDEQKSFIDANNFFVMEMESYKQELSKKSLLSNFWQEKLIFFINKKISNFSQSWFLPFLWILIINIGFYLFMKISNINFNILQFSISMIILLTIFIVTKLISEISKEYKNTKINFYTFQHIFIILSMLGIIYYFNCGSINDIMLFSNIQSYKDYTELSENKDVFNLWALHKILLGFLIYHFIISLRRQTKR